MTMARNFYASFVLIAFTTVAVALSGCSGNNAAQQGSAIGSPGKGTGTGGTVAGSGPTISGSPAQSVSVGAAYEFRPTATGAQDAKLSFSIENQPAWARFDAATGTLSGTPTAAHVGTYAHVLITVSDGLRSASLAPFSVSVTPRTAVVALSWSAPALNTNGTSATDLAGYHIYYGATSTALDHVITVDGAGTTNYTINNLALGTWYIAITAYNIEKVESRLSAVVPVTL